MNVRLMNLIVSSSLAIGFGFGFGLAASDQPVVLEATNTPIGSFVLKVDSKERLLRFDQHNPQVEPQPGAYMIGTSRSRNMPS